MDFGLMFFSSAAGGPTGERYLLMVDAAKRADAEGFCAVWTPERHFHPFGGLFPNPALTSAALAMVTSRLELRAGSLVSPLHDSIRIAESWSVVDNLSGGRAAISFASGWNIDDFVFFPERYAERQAVMYRQIDEVRTLWGGGALCRAGSAGRETEVEIYPKPVRSELPIWVTSSGNAETCASAGAVGANLLTHLIGQDLGKLAEKIAVYRRAREENGFDPAAGKVSLMLHTFVGDDLDAVRRTVRHPFREYLRSAISLEQLAALGGGVVSGGHRIDPHDIPDERMEELLDLAFERYFTTASLMGTPESCERFVWTLEEAGVDEIACLVDFIDDPDRVLAGLEPLARLRHRFDAEPAESSAVMAEFLEEIEA